MTDAAPITLTEPQAVMLRMVVAAAREGREAAGLDPVMCALERRDLVAAEPIKPGTHRRAPHRFVATLAGRDWVRAADARAGLAPAERITPSSLWQGTPVDGSRWTVGQLQVLRKKGIEDPECCAVGTIARRAKVNEHDWTMPPPLVRIELPCLAVTHDRRRGKLITPAGAVQWHDIVQWKAPARGR